MTDEWPLSRNLVRRKEVCSGAATMLVLKTSNLEILMLQIIKLTQRKQESTLHWSIPWFSRRINPTELRAVSTAEATCWRVSAEPWTNRPKSIVGIVGCILASRKLLVRRSGIEEDIKR